jgi:hypothetical protein
MHSSFHAHTRAHTCLVINASMPAQVSAQTGLRCSVRQSTHDLGCLDDCAVGDRYLRGPTLQGQGLAKRACGGRRPRVYSCTHSLHSSSCWQQRSEDKLHHVLQDIHAARQAETAAPHPRHRPKAELPSAEAGMLAAERMLRPAAQQCRHNPSEVAASCLQTKDQPAPQNP